MALLLHVHGGYPSYAESGAVWRRDDYDAHKLVQALKGHDINGYARLQRPGGQWVTIDQNNKQPALQIFGEWGSQKLRQLGLEGGLLVPVPSSSCIEFGGDEKGRALAQAIASRHAQFATAEVLCWDAALGKAAEGGTRNPDTLLDHLRVREDLAPSHVVLVDDVISTGGHLKACARALRARGHTVDFALCGAQTVWDHPEDMWRIEPRDIEAVDNLNFNF